MEVRYYELCGCSILKANECCFWCVRRRSLLLLLLCATTSASSTTDGTWASFRGSNVEVGDDNRWSGWWQ